MRSNCKRRGIRRRTALAWHAVVVGAVGFCAMPAVATTYFWNVPAGTWNNGPNWNPFGEPLTGDTAQIEYASNGICDVIGPVGSPASVVIGKGNTLNLRHDGLSDGSINVSGNMLVGDLSSATLNVFGRSGIFAGGQGDLFVGQNLFLSNSAVINQSGGTVTVGSSAVPSTLSIANQSSYNFSGGTLTTRGVLVRDLASLTVSGTAVGSLSTLSVNYPASAHQSGGQLVTGDCGVDNQYQLDGGTLVSAFTSVSRGTFSFNGGALSAGTLVISSAGQLHLSSGGGKVLRTASVSIGTLTGGTFDGGIDLADNVMIVDYTSASPLANILNLIQNGTYNGITQNCTGIVSSTAIINGGGPHPTILHAIEASSIGAASFAGQPVDATSILIRYTYTGDANFDGAVNALDFNTVATNFGKAGQSWGQGDFNNNGIVNTQDFTVLAMNFNQRLASPSPPVPVPVPEPRAPIAAIMTILAAIPWRKRGLLIRPAQTS